MRKLWISALILVFMSATAFASGWHQNKVQTRWGKPVFPNSGICSHRIAWAQVHDFGVRFTVMAWGCEPGHVFTVWGIVGSDPNPGGDNVTLNCGGGIVFPNGEFKTICDVPIGSLNDAIPQCQGNLAVRGGCAQLAEPPRVLEDPKNMDFYIDILTHDELDPAVSMAQIRTLTTCAFWDAFLPPADYPREDSCASVGLIKFAAP